MSAIEIFVIGTNKEKFTCFENDVGPIIVESLRNNDEILFIRRKICVPAGKTDEVREGIESLIKELEENYSVEEKDILFKLHELISFF